MAKVPLVSPEVQLRHAQLEQLMRWLLEVDDTRTGALISRMRLYRTRGFPPVANQVSKKRFFYDLDAVVRMSLGFLMIDALVPQDETPAIIETHWTDIRAAMAWAFRAAHALGGEQAEAETQRPVLMLKPRDLASLNTPKGNADASAGEDARADGDAPKRCDALVTDAASVMQEWAEVQKHEGLGAVTLIDLQHLAGWLRDALLAARWAGPEQFATY